ncbi:MAG: preprotein translocase subunit SecE [Acidobacteria bacterium]|nr:MAG: preprotein translocase subunit SecE [Acidobacteriota bacterium]RPJ83517.1 MAG: preprotein translocase subunit SecE [Acidobacteriota bacterium]
MLGVRVPPGLPPFSEAAPSRERIVSNRMLESVKEAPRNFINFYGDVKTELKKVTWPTKKEVYGTTVVVIVTVFFFGFYLALVDLLLSYGVTHVFNFFR